MGEAADIRLPLTPYTSWSDNKQHTDLDIAHQWMDWLEHHVDFDQLILETRWIPMVSLYEALDFIVSCQPTFILCHKS